MIFRGIWRRRIAALAVLGPLLAALMPAGRTEAAPLRVVASFSILGDIVRQIGGGDVAVTALVGPDGDAHVFEPSPADLRPLAAARLFIVNGLGLEGWLTRLIQSAQYAGPVVVASAGITPMVAAATEGGAGPAPDPHAWQVPRNVITYADNIRRALAGADPAHAADYDARFAEYHAALTALDGRVRAALAAIPPDKRRVITTHDAFAYYGRAYGIAFLAPLGISTDSEPSAHDIAGLIRQIRREHINALFFENISDPRLMQELASETGAVLGPPLYSDALSPPDGPASTYIKMVDYNTAALAAGMKRN